MRNLNERLEQLITDAHKIQVDLKEIEREGDDEAIELLRRAQRMFGYDHTDYLPAWREVKRELLNDMEHYLDAVDKR